MVLQALLIRKDQIEYLKNRAIIQALVDKEKAQEALDAYRDSQFPYFQKIQRDQRSEHIKRLAAEVQRGPLAVTPLVQKRVRSKLKTRVVEREETLEDSRRLSRKISGYL